LLKEEGFEYRYREYTRDPLTAAEISDVLRKLGMTPHDLLRRNDKAAKENDVTGEESAEELIELMAKHPTLLQRPIGVLGARAELGRPIENLLRLGH
jgi:arsenate reductase (glutaredoxin)